MNATAAGLLAMAFALTPASRGAMSETAAQAASRLILVTQLPDGSEDHGGEDALPEGSRLVLLDLAHPAAPVKLLTPGFAAAGRASVADDGRRFLFVGRRKPGEPLDAWEGDLRGGTPRRVTHRSRDCLDAVFLSTLYTIDATEPEPRLGLRGVTEDGTTALFTCRPDGSDERRITFTPCAVGRPLFIADGRLVYASGCTPTAGELDGAATSALFVVNVDGTDVQAFAGVDDGPAMRGTPCETADGRVVYVESSRAGRPGSALVSVREARSRRSRVEILDEPAALLRSPAALPDGMFLLCRKAEGSSWDLVRLDVSSAPRVEPLLATGEWDEVEAVAAFERAPRPGRSSVVDPRQPKGALYCLDARRTGLEPPSEAGAGPTRLEVLTAVRRDGAAPIGSRLLATVTVDADGSFSLRVPPRTPLRLRLLDESGRVVSDMTSWIWVMPRESRGCVGCHEDPELCPPNRQVLALRNIPQEVEP